MLLNELEAVSPKLYAAGTAMELISGPGIGKSETMYAIAAKMSILLKAPFAVMTMICSGIDPADVRGFLFPTKDAEGGLHARFTRPTVFPSPWNIDVYIDGVKKTGEYQGPIPDHGILFFDEFAQADPEVQKPLGQVLLTRTMGEYSLPPHWVVWAASNRTEDRSGVVKQLAFLQNRRKVIPIEPSYAAWEVWAVNHNIHPLVISFARQYPNFVFKDAVPKEPGAFTTPRSLVLCATDLLALRDDSHGDLKLPDDAVALEVVRGWLGEATQPVFMTHCRLANELPEISEVLNNPEKAKIPGRPDACYVMAMALAHHVTKKNIGAIITYISRLPHKEIQILFVVHTAMRRQPEIMSSPEFQKWTAENADLALIAFG